MTPDIVLVLGVPHSGTNFAEQLVRGDRRNVHGLACRLAEYGSSHLLEPGGYATVRTDECSDGGLRDLCKNSLVVVPVRSPRAVALSWVARGKNLDQMLAQWDRLIALAADFPFAYLPLDSPRRNEFLTLLASRLEVPLTTDWAEVGSFKSERALPPEYDARLADLERRDFFRRLYA